MGLLAPLYALAALAIVGPIVFHLIRRQPQGQIQFSSLMFLSPSPPRLTRRSRLDNLLLLLLRALAILLIAAAFARPYLRQESFLSTSLQGRNVVILVDTSASMQRVDVWQAAQEQVAKVVDSLSPEDSVSLYSIDQELAPIIAFAPENARSTAEMQQSVRKAIKDLKPSWLETNLALGLRSVADRVTAALINGELAKTSESEVVLVSDLHTECGLESLQGYPWPESIKLDVRRILPATPGNARASLMPADDATPEAYRVRIENNSDSVDQTFVLNWASSVAPLPGSENRVQVPAGQVRVIPMPAPLTSNRAQADRILLTGDAWNADNEVFVIESEPLKQKVAYFGEQEGAPESNPAYFLRKAPISSPLIQREVLVQPVDEFEAVLLDSAYRTIVVEPSPQLASKAPEMRGFADNGGTLVVLLAREEYDAALNQKFLEDLLDVPSLEITEAEVDDFALTGRLDYRHPVFAPFADPRFNDFSKLRFWSHRTVTLPERASDAGLSVVAEFDDAAPFLLQKRVGDGSIWVMTTGWQPEASGLALSSKFIPILMGILDPESATRKSQLIYAAGEKIPVEEASRVVSDEGYEADSKTATIASKYVRILTPGLFDIEVPGQASRRVAIQLPASESQLVPQDVDVFEQYGVSLGKLATASQRLDSERQLKVEELEQKQRLWQWLIAAGIFVLGIETIVAGWLARRGAAQVAAT